MYKSLGPEKRRLSSGESLVYNAFTDQSYFNPKLYVFWVQNGSLGNCMYNGTNKPTFFICIKSTFSDTWKLLDRGRFYQGKTSKNYFYLMCQPFLRPFFKNASPPITNSNLKFSTKNDFRQIKHFSFL